MVEESELPCIPLFHFFGRDMAEIEKYAGKKDCVDNMIYLAKQSEIYRKLSAMKEY
jgi:hypothetical protein